MSKKKRNRRPHATHASGPAPATSVVAEREDLEAAEDADDAADEAPLESIASMVQAAGSGDREPSAPPAPAAGAGLPTPALTPSAGWTPHESGDIRGVLIQVAGGRLLLPNATIAEVLSYAEPDAADTTADWLLGRFRWRGWQLPLIAFSRLAGIGEERPGLGSKVVVLKALGGDRRIPFFALLTQGFPRLVTVSRDALAVEAGDDALPDAVQARVRLNDEPALLPDLLRIEHLLQAEREAA